LIHTLYLLDFSKIFIKKRESRYISSMRLFLTLMLFLLSCSQDSENRKFTSFRGRGLTEDLIYRAHVPPSWELVQTSNSEDTTHPLAEYRAGEVVITLHNFPLSSLDKRIPPIAQVNRWKRQIGQPHTLSVQPTSHGGYAGLVLEGTGDSSSILAFALSLDDELFQALRRHFPHQLAEQMGGDVTIKAVGNEEDIQKYRDEIKMFANSFELTEEIPWL